MLIGTYIDGTDYVAVVVERDPTGTTLVIEDRTTEPGAIGSARVRGSFATDAAALSYSRGHVLASAGHLGQAAEALACSPVPAPVARRMFSRSDIHRYVHIPLGLD